MFSSKFFEIFKNTFFTEQLSVTVFYFYHMASIFALFFQVFHPNHAMHRPNSDYDYSIVLLNLSWSMLNNSESTFKTVIHALYICDSCPSFVTKISGLS